MSPYLPRIEDLHIFKFSTFSHNRGFCISGIIQKNKGSYIKTLALTIQKTLCLRIPILRSFQPNDLEGLQKSSFRIESILQIGKKGCTRKTHIVEGWHGIDNIIIVW
ncbi:hypothetical protein FRX31_013327 [Thalictrum thalictroides]|uniref:Uncharacterized protein n=1 Tax=Thalictrum thalictroides TaxID=46969 RepID=A0A7J6WI40_THATH|nr:hypothetical protein FRX31_013327 [Thalictrum thalictroides]